MTLQTPPALAEILARPNTIKFRDDSDEADFGDLDLSTNPQKSPSGPFLWVLPDRVTEATYTVAAKVFYSGIGNKTGPYFSLPDSRWMPDITPDEMLKAKVGFSVRFINRDLVVDSTLSDELIDHNQAALEFFLTIQERADMRLASFADEGCPVGSVARPAVNQKPFLKFEDGNLFYVLPTVSTPLFPQFRGPRSPGVMRAGRQRGRIPLNPAGGLTSTTKRDAQPGSPRVLFGDLPDPKGRYTTLKANPTYSRYEMCIPPVFLDDGSLVVPSKYEELIPDGTLVAVRGKMKMYDILSRDRLSINRPYMFVFDRLQVVGKLVSGWDDEWDNHVAQACKKRTFEMGPAEGDSKSSKWRAAEDSDEDL